MSELSRGEIWYAELDPTRGREQAGKRPVLIVSTNPFNRGKSELAVVLPITSKDKGVGTHVRIEPGGDSGLRTASFVMCEAIRCVSRDRLGKWIGNLDGEAMSEVENRLRLLLEL